jgi:hypothetical protein
MLKIFRTVTSDSADGRPWPPTERNVLWAMVRRGESCTLWRAIEFAESDPPATDFAILQWAAKLKG